MPSLISDCEDLLQITFSNEILPAFFFKYHYSLMVRTHNFRNFHSSRSITKHLSNFGKIGINLASLLPLLQIKVKNQQFA